jgi:DNA-binding transcriptional ArsR family regulator
VGDGVRLGVIDNQAVLAAISSVRRQELLRIVWTDERTAGELHAAMPDVTFGAISLQMKRLVDAGLVRCRAQGRNRYYRANRDALGTLAATLEAMWSDALWRLKLAAELEEGKRGPRRRPRVRRKR